MVYNTCMEISFVAAAGVTSTPPEVWWTVIAFVFVGFLIYSAILTFHWFSYGLDTRVAWATSLFYYAVSAILFFTLAVSALSLSFS